MIAEPQNNVGDDGENFPEGFEAVVSEGEAADLTVGERIREIRTQKGMTLKSLSEASKVNINTLSLIENGKTCPSIGTLQRLAKTLKVSITSFFEAERASFPVVFTARDQYPMSSVGDAYIQNLGKSLPGSTLEPFVVILPKNAGSGGRTIIHGGYEFAYCLSGQVLYRIEEVEYTMSPGDSVLFAAHLPHRWENVYDGESRLILITTPAETHAMNTNPHL